MSPKRILNYYVDLSYLPKCTERFLDCVVQENIHTPSLPPPPVGGHFCIKPSPPWSSHSTVCLLYPYPLEFP